MAITDWKNLPNTSTPVNATNLNKIQESNIYSTDEIEIGKWIDGKSIYRKVFVNTYDNKISVNDYPITISFGDIPFENIIKIENVINCPSWWGTNIVGSTLNGAFYNYFGKWVAGKTRKAIDLYGTIPLEAGTVIYTILEYTKTN